MGENPTKNNRYRAPTLRRKLLLLIKFPRPLNLLAWRIRAAAGTYPSAQPKPGNLYFALPIQDCWETFLTAAIVHSE